ALQVATSALHAFQFVGLPEGVLNMTQAVLYLATAPKSNSSLTTYGKARKDVLDNGPLPVPLHLRNAPTSLMKEHGYGKGYRYPHDFEGAKVEQQYLPDELQGRRYFEPSNLGFEQKIRERLRSHKIDDQDDSNGPDK
ncbi:MAG: replication-associated recombination protein A, partial [Pseudomonadota bacterium]